MNRDDIVGKTIGHLTFYAMLGGDIGVKCNNQQMLLRGHEDDWTVRIYSDIEEAGTLEDCVAWCQDFCRTSFIQDYPRRDLKHKPLFRHDMFETEHYTVLLDQTDKQWEFIVEVRSTGEKLLTRSFYKSYEAAVEGFAGWLWDSGTLVVTQSDVERYCDWLTEQCHNTMQEMVTNWFLVESTNRKEDYHAYLWANGNICGWRYRTNRRHYSYASPRLYVGYVDVVRRIARDIYNRGVEENFGFKPFFSWLEEQNEQH